MTGSSLLLDLAVRKGLLTLAQADLCRKSLGPEAQPLPWLTERKLISAQEAEALEQAVQRLLAQPDHAAARSRFGPYELVRELGAGGMGVVYAARDTRLGRDVAVKILQRPKDLALLHRFTKEAQVLAKLHHPKIVAVFDVGEEEGQPYLVMELIEGASLHDALERRTLSRREAVEVVRQAAEGIAYAHRHGVLHRDLKPSNILVTPDKRAVVMDFGLAKTLEAAERSFSQDGALVGTPAYMSPEQAAGRAADRRSDVWGLGATLYHAAVGRPPFSGKSVAEVLHQIVDREPRPLRKFDPDLDPDLECICLKALEKDPPRRYPDAASLAADLGRYLAGEPIAARPPSVSYRFGKWIRRRKLWVGAAAAAVVLALAGAEGLSRWSRARTFRRIKSEATEAFDSGRWAIALAKCEEALRTRADPTLEEMARRSRATLDEESAHRDLHDRLRPIEAIIRDARLYCYIKGVDFEDRILRVRAALEELEGILRNERHMQFPEGWRTLGMGRYFVGDSVRAEEALLETRRLAPRDGVATYYLLRIYQERAFCAATLVPTHEGEDSVEEARRWSRRALELLEGDSVDWEGIEPIDRSLASAYRALAEHDGRRIVSLCEEGLRDFSGKVGSEEFLFLRGYAEGPSKGIATLDAVLDRAPNHAMAFYVRGLWRNDLGQGDPALEDWTRCLRLAPQFVPAYVVRGHLWDERRAYDRAVADYSEVLRMIPDHFHALRFRASSRLEIRDFAGALADSTEAIRLRPDHGCTYSIRAIVRQRGGDLDGALADCEESIRLEPTANALALRGLIRGEKGDRAGEILDYTRAIQLDPKHVDSYVNRAGARGASGDLEGALQDCEAALRLQPQNAEALTNRGNIRKARRDFDGAIADFSAALKSRADLGGVWGMRGVCRRLKGDFDGAIEDLARAVELSPDLPDFLYERGMAWEQKGSRDKAAADYRKTLSIAPSNWTRRANVEQALSRVSGP